MSVEDEKSHSSVNQGGKITSNLQVFSGFSIKKQALLQPINRLPLQERATERFACENGRLAPGWAEFHALSRIKRSKGPN